jgi:hypothetical protein
MTLEEKRKKVIELCDAHFKEESGTGICDTCPCSNILTGFCSINDDWFVASEEDLDKALKLFEKAKSSTTTATEPPSPPDMINHPSHYCREGGMECLDEMMLVFGVKNTIIFCLMNSHKYRYRSSDKNGEEDLKKSDWYYAKAKELMECHNIKSWMG